MILCFLLLTSGCSAPNPDVFPDVAVLPSGAVGKEYRSQIKINGGPVNKSSVSVIIVPEGSGLMWEPEAIKYKIGNEDGVNVDYHKLIILGVTKKPGDYDIIVSGYTLGTMKPGRGFYKKYSLTIK
ncbi:hypothetical protein [Pantoea sp. S18]|uniref:hypothetical protein n=1 Tax=Pantoea sp. S18 TaxID=3019892 RepID=UPI002B1F5B8C|nr:hypothetical protein [Pantoea sp. S18]MEA5103966.1 hypothetical protein [Pantoea sp. S18]